MNVFRRMVCKHSKKEFVRNIHGDEINYISPPGKTYRSIWKCKLCEKIIFTERLHLAVSTVVEEVLAERNKP